MKKIFFDNLHQFNADHLAECDRFDFIYGELNYLIDWLETQHIDLYTKSRRDKDVATIKMILAKILNDKGFKHKYIAHILGYKTPNQISKLLTVVNDYYNIGDKRVMMWTENFNKILVA